MAFGGQPVTGCRAFLIPLAGGRFRPNTSSTRGFSFGTFPMQPTSVYTRDRCVTGIHGLDEILRGGIPYGSTVLAAGTCGSGKTTLGMEFLVRGALAGEA